MAFERALATLKEGEHPVYTLGPLVHNEHAVAMLERLGMRTAKSIEEVEGGVVVVRAHGIPADLEKSLHEKGVKIVDATCPHVKRIEREAVRLNEEGRFICFAGYPEHPETKAVVSRLKEGTWKVLSSVDDVESVPRDVPVALIAQSTFNTRVFESMTARLQELCDDLVVKCTICNATSARQEEARELAKRNDAVVVVGSRTSSNTRRLVEIAKAEGKPVFHVTSAEDVSEEDFRDFHSVGVTAGASTPTWLTWSVVEVLRGAGESRSLRRLPARMVTDGGVLTGVAAASLSYAMTGILGAAHRGWWSAASAFYIFSMYTLIRTQRRGVPAFTSQGLFLYRNRKWLYPLAISSGAVALVITYAMSTAAFLAVAGSYVLAASYAVASWKSHAGGRASLLLRLPASKDIFEAGAWTMMCTLLPALGSPSAAGRLEVWSAGVFVFLLLFTRAVLRDVVNIQDDRIMGRETVPALLGEKAVWYMVYALLGVLAVLPAFVPLRLGVPLWVGVCLAAACAYVLKAGKIRTQASGLLLLDGALVVVGVVSGVLG